MKVIKDTKYKVFNRYKKSQINIWDLVQLEKIKNKKTHEKSYSSHIEILKKDPKRTWRLIWRWVYTEKGKEFLLHTKFIEINYSNRLGF